MINPIFKIHFLIFRGFFLCKFRVQLSICSSAFLCSSLVDKRPSKKLEEGVSVVAVVLRTTAWIAVQRNVFNIDLYTRIVFPEKSSADAATI